jgi:hypothetical protein
LINFLTNSTSGKPIELPFSLESKDVTEEKKKRFIKDYNPLDPKYVLYSKSRRRKMEFGEIEKSRPKKHISPKTRRNPNKVDDIEGTKSK